MRRTGKLRHLCTVFKLCYYMTGSHHFVSNFLKTPDCAFHTDCPLLVIHDPADWLEGLQGYFLTPRRWCISGGTSSCVHGHYLSVHFQSKCCFWRSGSAVPVLHLRRTQLVADSDSCHTYESVPEMEIMITFDVCSPGVEVDD